MDHLPNDIVRAIAHKMDAPTVVRFSIASRDIQRSTLRISRTASGFVNIRRAVMEYGIKKTVARNKKRATYTMIETIFKYRDVWQEHARFRKKLFYTVLPILLKGQWIPLKRREKYCRLFINSNVVFADRHDLPMNIKIRSLMYPVFAA